MDTMTTTKAARTIGATVDRTRFAPIGLTRHGHVVAVLVDSAAWAELLHHLQASDLPGWLRQIKSLKDQPGSYSFEE